MKAVDRKLTLGTLGTLLSRGLAGMLAIHPDSGLYRIVIANLYVLHSGRSAGLSAGH